MILIDSNIFISYYNTEDENHDLATKLINEIEKGKYGNALISDYIFSEVITVGLIKLKNKQKVVSIGSDILKGNIKVLKINNEIFIKAWDLFKNYFLKMSFTDFTNLAILDLLKIRNIATFDKDFKKIKDIKVIDK